MIEIEDKIVSSEILTCYFACDYCKCKGECCVEGDSGAPLEIDECGQLEDNFEKIEKYLTNEGKEAILKDGAYVIDMDGDYTTTLVHDAECAYSFVEDGNIMCAIERAYRNGDIDFNKPLSCHLYPIRLVKLKNGFTGLNYHRWSICKDAITKGEKECVKVYQGLKEPLIRAFGEQFYTYLQEVDQIIENGEEEIEEEED